VYCNGFFFDNYSEIKIGLAPKLNNFFLQFFEELDMNARIFNAVVWVMLMSFRFEAFGFKLIFENSEPNGLVLDFRLKGGLMLVKGKVEEVEGFFIFDSGAPDLVLNVYHFKHLAKPSGEIGSGIIGSAGQIYLVKVKDFDLDSFALATQKNVKAVDLSLVEKSKGLKVMGLIGVSVFENYEISIDYAHSKIFLYDLSTPKIFKHELDSLKATDTIPLKMHQKLIYTTIKIGDKKLKMGLDTGAELNLLHIKLPKKILSHFTIQNRVLMSGAGNETIEVLAGVAAFEIWGVDYPTLPTMLSDLSSLSEAYGMELDGILGFPFLSWYRCGFNLKKGEFYVERKKN
jgi:hypothetical protein